MHQAAVVEACAQLGNGHIRAVPVSVATFDGIARHALHHEEKNNWHFLDPGRYFLAQAVLNVIQQAITESDARPDEVPGTAFFHSGQIMV